jgi:hypothetical protein
MKLSHFQMETYHERAPAGNSRRQRRAVYSGQTRLASIKQIDDEYIALDQRGQVLGRFNSTIEAANAISRAAARGRIMMDTSRCDYLLAELRAASLRARLWQADIEAVGLALKAGLVEPEQALALLHDCDALYLVAPDDEGAS